MQQSQWLNSHDAVAMLASISDQLGSRKTRLFGCACCRHFRKWLHDSPFTEAVETAETFADGKTSKAALKRARESVRAARHALPSASTKHRIEWVALWLAEVVASENAFGGVTEEIQRFVSEGLLYPSEQPRAASLLRCIAGNPFQVIHVDVLWRTPEVITLTQSIYDEATFDQMHELAKQLKTSGCTNLEILSHCTNENSHGRGCWVVDQLLGNS